MTRLFLAAIVLSVACLPAGAMTVERSYTYFTIGGSTLSEIEDELQRRGPTVGTTNRRHPGATRMEFSTRVTYGESGGRCGVVDAGVELSANVILPRWRRPRDADPEVRVIWDTLEADIRRHEESHIVIARNHARELEQALRQVTHLRDCETAAARVRDVTDEVLARHDEAQARFDRIEGINFESRILRLLQYRLERIEDGRLPPP